MKNQSQQLYQNTIDLTQTQSFWTIWTTIKNSIFDVLFVLLDNSEDSQSMFGLVFQTGIDYLQMMAFPFNSAVIVAWNAKDTLNGITNFFNNFNVSTYIPGVGFSTFLVLLYSLIVLIIIVLCDICYVAYSFSKKKFTFTFPLIFMAKVVPVFVTVLFLPIMETLLQVTNCQTSSDSSKQVLQSFPQVICWQGWHLFHTTITLVFSFLFVLLSCIVALALFQPRMTTSRLTARQNSTGQVIFIVNKIICQFIFSFSPFEGTLPYCALLFVLSGWLFYAYNIAQPYYDKNASKFFRICSSYYFWTNLMLLVSSMLESIGFQDGLVIWICGMIFIGLIIAFQRKSNIDTLFSSSLKFKSGEQLEGHLNYVLQLHHNRQNDKNSYMLLLGYIQKHIELCLQEDCPLKYNKLKFSSGKQEEQHSYQQLMKQLQRMFNYGIKKYPYCTKLRISLAFFYLQKEKNSMKAYQNFVKALETSPSFGEQFIIYRFKKIISENFQQTKQNSETDLIQLIRFDNHIKLCQEGMVISAKLQKQFWNQLLEESPSLQRLNLIGSKIIESRDITKENYEEVMKVNCNGDKMAELRYAYGMYLIYICHESSEGRQEVKRSLVERDNQKKRGLKKNRKKQLSKINEIENTKRCLLICQFNQLQTEKQPSCKIKKANRQLLELIKYSQQLLIEKKLQEILPKNFQLFHDRRIDSYLSAKEFGEQETAKEQDNTTNKLKVQTKSNFSHIELNKIGYMGEYQLGFLRLSTGFIKRIKYRVVYQYFQGKFIAEIIPCPQIGIISDIEGIISEIDQSFLALFPEFAVALSLQDILGYQTMDMVEKGEKNQYTIQKDQLSQTVRSCFKNYELSLQKIKICLDQKQINYDKTLNFDQTINIVVQPSIKYIGFALIISKTNNFRGNTFIDNKKQPKKRMNCFSDITKIIQNTYLQNNFCINMVQSENSQQNSIGPEKSFSENHSRDSNLKSIKQRQYNLYQSEDGMKQIKIFRYIDHKFVRIYCDNLLQEDSDYDLEQKIIDIQGKMIKEKLKDKNYKQKVKSALNAKFLHPEIITLFVATSFLLLAFVVFQVQLFIHIREQSQIEAISQISLAKNNLNDVFSISTSLSELIINNKISDEALNDLRSHRVQYLSSKQDPIIFVNSESSRQQITIRNVLIRLQSTVLSFLNKQSNKRVAEVEELKYVYYNYLKYVTPRISEDYPLQVSKYGENVVEMEVILSYSSSITLGIFLLLWIYQSLKINSKIYKLLVWFLDIPFQYLHFASRQCQNFHQIYVLKNSNPLPIEQSEVNSYGEQYELKKEESDSFDAGQRASENEKNRQIQIFRHNKKSLKEFFSVKELLKSIIVMVLLSLTLTLVILHINAELQLDIVFQLMRVYSREYIWISNMPLILQISLNKSQWAIFQPGQIQRIRAFIQQNVDESSEKGVQKFIQQTFTGSNSLLSVEILKNQIDMQFSDVCQDQTMSQATSLECLDLVNGKLKGGYSVFRQYIKDLQQNIELQQIIEIEKSMRKFTGPLLKKILIGLLDEKQSLIKDLGIVLELYLYIFMVVLLTSYLFPWNIMLIRTNKKINQTIQILNIVPINLLPIARKENRKFFRWIMKKSSQLYKSKSENH